MTSNNKDQNSRKILIIDDSITVRGYIKNFIKDAGYIPLEAGNGFEGIEQLKKHKDIALVLCDINMPELDGLSMLEKLHNDSPLPKDQPLPIFFILSTETTRDLAEQAKKFGAKGWIIKPLSKSTFNAAIRSLTQ